MARRGGNKRNRNTQKRMKTKIYDLLPNDLQKIAEEMGFRREKRGQRNGRRNGSPFYLGGEKKVL